jgi:hypothetical protein
MTLGAFRERSTYRQVRHEVLEAIRGSGLSFDSVILATHGHDGVEDLGKCLKRENVERLRQEWGIS